MKPPGVHRFPHRFSLFATAVALPLLLGTAPVRAGSENSTFAPSPSDRSMHVEERASFTSELWGDLKFIARDQTFYLVMSGLCAVPIAGEDLLEGESTAINRHLGRSSTADALLEPTDVLGSGAVPIAASALLFGTGRLAHAPRLTAMASDLVRAEAINGLLTQAMKRAFNRTRPNGANYSYPSGHTSSAFTAAGVVAHYTGSTWGWVARGGAAMIATSRLQENKHFVSDLVAGAVLGTYIASAVTGRHHATALHLSPWVDTESVGAQVSLALR